MFPTGSFEGQSVEYFQPAPLDTLRDARLYNFPQRAFSVDIQFSQFNIGDSDSCQGNEDMENWFAIRTAPQPPTFNYQCVGRNTLPAPLEFQLKPEDYETRISLSTTKPVSPASVSLALKYKGQFYHFDKSNRYIKIWYIYNILVFLLGASKSCHISKSENLNTKECDSAKNLKNEDRQLHVR